MCGAFKTIEVGLSKSVLVIIVAARGAEMTHLPYISHSCVVVIAQEGSSREGSSHSQPPVRLFHIHGTNEFNTRATEVTSRSSSLNSNDVFVLSTDKCCYLWYGKVGRV